MRAAPAVVVEISAAGRSLAHWRGMPGVTIIDEVPWPVYVERSRSVGADIVLVPLLSTPVNDLRADTKRIDVARFGAAGLFSKSATYGYAAEGDEMLCRERCGCLDHRYHLPDRRSAGATPYSRSHANARRSHVCKGRSAFPGSRNLDREIGFKANIDLAIDIDPLLRCPQLTEQIVECA